MKFMKAFKNIFTGLYLSIKRFPATILISIAIVGLLITINELSPVKDTLVKITLVCALGIPLSLTIKLFFERKKGAKIFTLIGGYAAGAIFLIFYYFMFMKELDNMVAATRYVAVTLAFYLAFLFTPYFIRRKDFETYVIAIIISFFTTILYSAVLYGGLSAILFTIDKLLGIQIAGKIYYYTFLFVVFIFGISYFLSGVPEKDRNTEPGKYPKLLRVLLLYIVMPLLTAYTVILYIYFGKIIATMKWPEGMVSNLVLWYSVIVTLTLFLITPLFSENSWAYNFKRFGSKLILPLLVMMFISIRIRIKAYGVTEPRYYVVLLGAWVFCIMLYFSIVRNLRNIIIPISLALITLFAVFGPLSSYSVSRHSQNKRFENILVKNNMLQNGKIESSTDISKEDKADIGSILNYFNQNHSLKEVKYLPKDFKMDDMETMFGFSYEGPVYEGPSEYFYYTRDIKENPIDISGYDYFIDMASLKEKRASGKGLYAIYDYDSGIIKISYSGDEIYKKNLKSFAKDITSKHVPKNGENTLSTNEMTMSDENSSVKIKILFQNISGSSDKSSDSIEINGMEFYLMFKIK